MDINATLIGQMITFIVFVVFTMKYVWPPITKAMQEREKKIADGLAAAERGEHSLELAQKKAVEIIHEAKQTAAEIVEHANNRAMLALDDAKENARIESDRIIAHARTEIKQQINAAKQKLHNEVANLALGIAEKIVEQDINPATHQKLLDKMAGSLVDKMAVEET